jgi:hypothetical protein
LERRLAFVVVIERRQPSEIDQCRHDICMHTIGWDNVIPASERTKKGQAKTAQGEGLLLLLLLVLVVLLVLLLLLLVLVVVLLLAFATSSLTDELH